MLFMKRENVPLPSLPQRLYCVTENSPENRVVFMSFFCFALTLSVSLRSARTEVDCLKILCVLSPAAAAWRVTEEKTVIQISTQKEMISTNSASKNIAEFCTDGIIKPGIHSGVEDKQF